MTKTEPTKNPKLNVFSKRQKDLLYFPIIRFFPLQ